MWILLNRPKAGGGAEKKKARGREGERLSVGEEEREREGRG